MRTANEAARVSAEETARAIEAIWLPVEQSLNRRDPMAALEEIGRMEPRMRHVMRNKAEAWFTRELALPPTDQCQWFDDQGLYRLIYLIWEEIPIRVFYVEMIPDLMANFDRYDRKYKGPGSWISK